MERCPNVICRFTAREQGVHFRGKIKIDGDRKPGLFSGYGEGWLSVLLESGEWPDNFRSDGLIQNVQSAWQNEQTEIGIGLNIATIAKRGSHDIFADVVRTPSILEEIICIRRRRRWPSVVAMATIVAQLVQTKMPTCPCATLCIAQCTESLHYMNITRILL